MRGKTGENQILRGCLVTIKQLQLSESSEH